MKLNGEWYTTAKRPEQDGHYEVQLIGTPRGFNHRIFAEYSRGQWRELAGTPTRSVIAWRAMDQSKEAA